MRKAIHVVLLVGLAWIAPSRSLAQLTYVEYSSGLETPDMEGGDTEIELGDVNGDGHVDIVSVGDHGSPYVNADEHGVMVWFGDGAGTWLLYQNGNFGYGGIALGDVNNDGLTDVGYGVHHDISENDFGDQILEVALGDGTGQNWMPWDDGLATNGESWGMFGTDFADVDNDGDLDVGSVSFGCCAGVHVYLNNGDGTWTQSFGFLNGNADDVFVFGEVNGDGFVDFATAHGSGTVYFGDGTGDFSLADGNLPAPMLWGVALGDVNDDGRDDLAYASSSGGLRAYTWVSPGVWQDVSGTLPAGGGFDMAQIADMDLDGHGDVIGFAGGSGGSPGTIVVYGGDGTGSWQQIASVATPDNDDLAACRAGVDGDHNGFPDLCLVQNEYVGGLPIAWRNRLRFFAESSAPDSMWVYPVSPRGGETLIGGAVRFIDWHAAVPDSSQPAMTIELSLDGSNGPWMTIAADEPNNGRYQWLVPEHLPTSLSCHLRFTLGDAEAVTPASFTIIGSSPDCNANGIPDACDIDCGPVGGECDIPGCGQSADGDADGVPDECEAIPAVSEWGMLIMTLSVLVTGTWVLMGRHQTNAYSH